MKLTVRQTQVLQRIAAGMDTNQIAADMFLSPNTVKVRVQQTLERLDARNRAHAVHIAHLNGIL